VAQGKFRKRMSSPGAETGVPVVVLVLFILFFGIPAVAFARNGPSWLAVLCGMPLALAAGYWLFGRVLLLFALLRLRCRGVVVYSNSPIWQAHIEREWLPALSGAVVTLNWSERATWRNTLPVLRLHLDAGVLQEGPYVCEQVSRREQRGEGPVDAGERAPPRTAASCTESSRRGDSMNRCRSPG
jgi:hypothetical protein